MKPLQGNLDFFLIRASRGPFRLKNKTQGPSHIHNPKGKLLLRCSWKDGLPLQTKTGNQLSSPDDMGCPDLSSCCFTEIDVPYRLEMGVSGNLGIVVKDVKPLVVYDVECEMAMDSMKGKCASS